MTTTTPPRPDTDQPDDAPRGTAEEARLRFREPVSTVGFIDAAWWPRTLDLTTELPALMHAMRAAGRDINRITYHLRSWDAAPRHLQVGDRTVRLGGFTVGNPDTVTLTDAWGREHIDILVISPDTEPDIAQRVFQLAAQTDNPYRAGEIVARANADNPTL